MKKPCRVCIFFSNDDRLEFYKKCLSELEHEMKFLEPDMIGFETVTSFVTFVSSNNVRVVSFLFILTLLISGGPSYLDSPEKCCELDNESCH